MNSSVKLIITATAGLAIGGAAGYFVAKKVLNDRFDTLLDEEVMKVKEFYKAREESSEKKEDTPKITEESIKEVSEKVEIVDEANNLMEDLGYSEKVESETYTKRDGSTYTVQSVGYEESNKVIPGFTNGDVIDYTSPEFKAMVADRDADYPYVITVDEFMDENPEFEKQCVSYFEEDDTLCDERDIIIEDMESTIGVENLEFFGKYSKDDNIVYIRNERISVDFEVAFHKESYVDLITGFKKRKMME